MVLDVGAEETVCPLPGLVLGEVLVVPELGDIELFCPMVGEIFLTQG